MLRLSGMLCLDFEDSPHQSTSLARLMKCHYSGGSQQWKWIATSHQVLLLLLFTTNATTGWLGGVVVRVSDWG